MNGVHSSNKCNARSFLRFLQKIIDLNIFLMFTKLHDDIIFLDERKWSVDEFVADKINFNLCYWEYK